MILASDNRKVAATPLALVRVAGLTLAQRTIRTIKLADIRRFVVVNAVGSESVRMHFDQVGRSEDVRLEFLVAESSHQGDGSCLLFKDSAGNRVLHVSARQVNGFSLRKCSSTPGIM